MFVDIFVSLYMYIFIDVTCVAEATFRDTCIGCIGNQHNEVQNLEQPLQRGIDFSRQNLTSVDVRF